MNYQTAHETMQDGACIRRPGWNEGDFLRLNINGVVETVRNGQVVALGYREFSPCDDYEVVGEPTMYKVTYFNGLTNCHVGFYRSRKGAEVCVLAALVRAGVPTDEAVRAAANDFEYHNVSFGNADVGAFVEDYELGGGTLLAESEQ